MALIFVSILFIHGLIHLLGAVKAFSLVELPDLNLPVSKPAGLLWLIASGLLLISTGLFFVNSVYWWALSITGIVISQGLIISSWSDAKYGTLPNIIILLVAIGAYADYSFDQKVELEVQELYSVEEVYSTKAELRVTPNMLNGIPYPVQRWLEVSGSVGTTMVSKVRLTQKGELRTDPEKDSWSDTEAEQYFNLDAPSFIWSVEIEMMPLVYVSGRDLYLDGKGQMLIKLYSLFDMVNESGEKIDRGALQRYLSEIVWFPSAALRSYIAWTEVDSTSAVATITWRGLSEKVTFHFDDSGLVSSVSADRFMGGGENAVRRPWRVYILKTEEKEGLMIPTDVGVSWELESEPFTWYRFSVGEINYDPEAP
jgi:hypothetical protein